MKTDLDYLTKGMQRELAHVVRVLFEEFEAQTARATFSTEPATAQRIVRAKRKIGAAGIPLRIPEPAERAERLDIVLTVAAWNVDEVVRVVGFAGA